MTPEAFLEWLRDELARIDAQPKELVSLRTDIERWLRKIERSPTRGLPEQTRKNLRLMAKLGRDYRKDAKELGWLIALALDPEGEALFRRTAEFSRRWPTCWIRG